MMIDHSEVLIILYNKIIFMFLGLKSVKLIWQLGRKIVIKNGVHSHSFSIAPSCLGFGMFDLTGSSTARKYTVD